MTIAVDLRSLMETGGKISGVENYLINVLDRLADLNPNIFGFYNSFSAVQMPKLNSKLKVLGSKIPNKILNSAQILFNYPKLESLYGNFDVLWMPDLRPFAIRGKTKLAITAHDLSPIVHPELYSLKRRIWHKVIGHKKSFKRADLIFAVSEYTKNDLVNLLGVEPKKIKVVYQGVNQHHFNPDLDQNHKNIIAKKYNLPEKFILAVSTLEPRKNLVSLVKAFDLVKDPDLHLVIAGRRGWLYKELFERIKDSPKKDKIILAGYVAETDKPYVISLAQIVCYPSYYEGFGIVPLEAMACGVPVMTSARTSIPEVIQDAAMLIEPHQLNDLVYAIDQLNKDQSLRRTFITKGLEKAKYFTWQKCVEEINSGLQSLL